MAENVTIAILAPLHPEDFFDLFWQGVWEATFDLSSFGVEVQNFATQHDDVDDQRKILEALLKDRPDAIGLLPYHVSALDDLIEQHVLLGTPVITFLGDAPDSRRVAFVGPDLLQAGALAGEVLAKLMGGQGRILSFLGSPDKFYFAQRDRGFRAGLARYGGEIEELPCHWRPGVSLENYERVAGYYIGDETPLQIAEAIEKLGVRAPCVGFSNTERRRQLLDRGVLSAVVDGSRYQVGYFAVQKAYEAALKRDDPEPVASLRIPSTVLFAANAAGAGDSLESAFELLVRQRTESLVSYKNRLEEANAKLLDLAITDPLTGLHNRRKFDETLNQEIVRALRYGPVGLLLIDLDHFKSVNDRHGHQAGDEALKAVARVLRSSCRETDICARLGGDEFAVILPHSDSGAAEVVRRRIQENMAGTLVPTAQGGLAISLSVGVATLPGDGETAAQLIAAADAAMYRTKQASRFQPA